MTAPGALKVLRTRTPFAGDTGRRLACVTAICCVAFALAPSAASAARCGPFTRVATAFDENIWAGAIPNFGYHGLYNLALQSYLQRCGPNVTRARHQVYIDTRRLPRGQKLGFIIWTRRSDGRWQVAPHDGFFTEVSGTKTIQQRIRYQYRTTYPPARLTHVRIKYWVLGAYRPKPVHTTTVAYSRFLGPQAGPAR